jgi:hypothetical protein
MSMRKSRVPMMVFLILVLVFAAIGVGAREARAARGGARKAA